MKEEANQLKFSTWPSFLGYAKKRDIHNLVNSSKIGIFIFCPTWSRVWLQHPTLNKWLYTTATVLMAAILTAARSCIEATTRLEAILSPVDRAVNSWQASSSPVTLFDKSMRRQTHCLTCQSLSKYRNITTSASHMWVVPSKSIDTCFPSISSFRFCSSFWSINGSNWRRLDEVVSARAFSSSMSQNLSTLLSGTPAFSIVVTTQMR